MYFWGSTKGTKHFLTSTYEKVYYVFLTKSFGPQRDKWTEFSLHKRNQNSVIIHVIEAYAVVSTADSI